MSDNVSELLQERCLNVQFNTNLKYKTVTNPERTRASFSRWYRYIAKLIIYVRAVCDEQILRY